MIRFLTWDSDFFNITIGELRVNSDITHLPELENYELLYVIQKSKNKFKIHGFKESYCDERVVFQKNLNNIKPIRNNKVYSVKEIDISLDKLYHLAYISGVYSRFRLDTNFKKEQFEAMYRAWIDNSINFNISSDLFVYKESNKVKGFISFKILDGVAKIGLIAVDEEFQGLGVGKQLIEKVEWYCVKHKCFKLEIPTQAKNKKACNFYLKNGYEISRSEIIKHYWKK